MPSMQSKIHRINMLASLNPDQAIDEAQRLIDSGYRAPTVHYALAQGHIRKNDYHAALDILMQAKVDYGHDDLQGYLRIILDRFRSEVNTPKKALPSTVRLNNLISDLVSKRKQSSWAGEDKSLEVTVGAKNKLDEKVTRIWRRRETKPRKCLEQAFELFHDGYRTEFICRCIAAGYRHQKRYKEEIDFLIQTKRDFEYYDFDSTLRQAFKLLEKTGESYQ